MFHAHRIVSRMFHAPRGGRIVGCCVLYVIFDCFTDVSRSSRGSGWSRFYDIRFRPLVLALRVKRVVGVRSSFPAKKPQFMPPDNTKFFSGPKIHIYHPTYPHRKSPIDPFSLQRPPLEKGLFFRPQNHVNALSDHPRRCTIPSCQSIHGPKVP